MTNSNLEKIAVKILLLISKENNGDGTIPINAIAQYVESVIREAQIEMLREMRARGLREYSHGYWLDKIILEKLTELQALSDNNKESEGK